MLSILLVMVMSYFTVYQLPNNIKKKRKKEKEGNPNDRHIGPGIYIPEFNVKMYHRLTDKL